MYGTQLPRVGRLWMFLTSSLLLYIGLIMRSRWAQSPPRQVLQVLQQSVPASIPSQDLYQFLNLSEQECRDTFPNLTEDLDATVALGPFTLKQTHGRGPLQARLKDGQLYIIHSEDENTLTPELLQARQAALHQINRAIITSPEALPDTIFSLNVRDQPYGTAWSYSRPAYAASASAMPPITRAFLMPHFSFWNWPLPSVGSIARAAEAISRIEESLPFARKDPRVVWRGSPRFNSAHHPTLRQDLLRVTAGAKWADVRALNSYEVDLSHATIAKDDKEIEGKARKGGSGNNEELEMEDEEQERDGRELEYREAGKEEEGSTGIGNTTIMIEDFCRYKYVLYTDGVTYSGRLPFLQMCGSVLLTPPMAWRQLTTHLLQPVFSQDLVPTRREVTEDMRNAWPKRYSPNDANAVFISPDWSDLEDIVLWLEDHPDVAAGIARRQRDLFVRKGYISPAMETCYWRALLRGWSQVVRLEGEGWDDKAGVSWESFSIN
ncbi:glycosyl transferase family 90-domain-containing protein [Xylaria sp. FL1777]|nr:glycosyl transferase family 90-domain-containing protein [Xylaria sp. FL1777]